MKNKSIYLALWGFVLLVGTQNLFGMSYLLNKYYSWRLGDKLVQDAKGFGNDRNALEEIVNKDYNDAVPLYVRLLQKVSFNESNKSYVKNVSKHLVRALKTAFYRPMQHGESKFFTEAMLDELNRVIDVQYAKKSIMQERLKGYFVSELVLWKDDLPNKDGIDELNRVIFTNASATEFDSYTVNKTKTSQKLALGFLEKCATYLQKSQPNFDKITKMFSPDHVAREKNKAILDELQNVASSIWLAVIPDYTRVFQDQMKFVESLTRVSAAERWYKNRMVDRLVDLYGSSSYSGR